MNTRLQGQMETMKTDQAGQMDEMLKSFEGHFKEMQERMEASHNDLRSLIITIQKTMHNMMDNTTGTVARPLPVRSLPVRSLPVHAVGYPGNCSTLFYIR
eukprot:scaffold124883_cov36-Attheya_sp.AAC.1